MDVFRRADSAMYEDKKQKKMKSKQEQEMDSYGVY